MSSQQSQLRRPKVLKSTLCAAWCFGALSLGRLVHDYVPTGTSSRQGTQHGSLRASNVLPSGMHFLPNLRQDTHEPGTVPGVFDGRASGALVAAAILACAVTMWGFGLQQFAGTWAHVVHTQTQAVNSGTSQTAPEKTIVASFTPVSPELIQVLKKDASTKKFTAVMSASAPHISSKYRPTKVAQLNAAAIRLRDSGTATLKNGHHLPATETMQWAAGAGSVALAAEAGLMESSAFRSYAQKRSASLTSQQTPGSSAGASLKGSTKIFSGSTTSLMSYKTRSATSAANKKSMRSRHDMSFGSLPGTHESQEEVLRKYLLDMRHPSSRWQTTGT